MSSRRRSSFAFRVSGSRKAERGEDINKLRITQGYLPKVPLMDRLYRSWLAWLDTGSDPFHSKLVAAGRIPVVTHVTLQMQSDAIEPDAPVSTPGQGNGGQPVDPGSQGGSSQAPKPAPGSGNGGGGGGSEGGSEGSGGESAPVCNPLTDPNRCMAPECGAASCCAPG